MRQVQVRKLANTCRCSAWITRI